MPFSIFFQITPKKKKEKKKKKKKKKRAWRIHCYVLSFTKKINVSVIHEVMIVWLLLRTHVVDTLKATCTLAAGASSALSEA